MVRNNFARQLASGAVLCVLAALAAPAQAQPVDVDKVIAVVDEDVVLKSELDERWTQVQQQIAQIAGPVPPEAELRKQLLDQIILEHLQLQRAERAGVRVDDNQLNDAMATIAQQNNMSFEQFRQVLGEQGIYEDTRDALRKEIIITDYQRGSVSRRINISRQEVENYLRSETGLQEIAPEYHVAHILIPNTEGVSTQAQAELATVLYERVREGANILQIASSGQISGIPVSGGDLNWAKSENLPSIFSTVVPELTSGEVGEPFTSPNGYHIVQVLETRGSSQLTVSQSRVRHILIKTNEVRTEQQAEALVNQLYQRILAGEDFEDIARQNTDDPNSVVAGGNLDWINTGMLPDDFMNLVNATQVGALTPPVHLSTGWHIVEVLDLRVVDMTEDNKRYQAQQILRERKFETELENWLTEIRDTSYVDIKEF